MEEEEAAGMKGPVEAAAGAAQHAILSPEPSRQSTTGHGHSDSGMWEVGGGGPRTRTRGRREDYSTTALDPRWEVCSYHFFDEDKNRPCLPYLKPLPFLFLSPFLGGRADAPYPCPYATRACMSMSREVKQ
eukprot:scaffold215540_cov41-Tisochrysis_lutea.AAC.1